MTHLPSAQVDEQLSRSGVASTSDLEIRSLGQGGIGTSEGLNIRKAKLKVSGTYETCLLRVPAFQLPFRYTGCKPGISNAPGAGR